MNIHWCNLIFKEGGQKYAFSKRNVCLHFISKLLLLFHVTEVDCGLVYFCSEDTYFQVKEKIEKPKITKYSKIVWIGFLYSIFRCAYNNLFKFTNIPDISVLTLAVSVMRMEVQSPFWL